MTVAKLDGGGKGAVTHSAQVTLRLVVNKRTIPLAQIAHDWVILAEPTQLEPGPAEVLLHVDGTPERWTVEILPHDCGSRRVPVRDLRD
jgi:hypothetical protein